MMSAEHVPLNELARELYLLQEEVRKKEKRISEIKEKFRGKGSFSTKDYIISIREIKKEVVGPSDQIKKTIGLEKLEAMGLIYNQTYLIVSVTAKGIPQGFL